MKSIEEKAKAYDEAIKVAQRFYNNSVAITKKGLEDIFPELVESEDEKIRKELIEFVKNSCFVRTKDSKYNREQMLAWLEKQCEQKPLNEKELFKAGYTEGFEDGVRDAYIKSEEQKPVWSEEDESIRQDAIRILFDAADRYTKDSGGYTPSWARCIPWLKSLKDRVQPQPKQEWSEEDESHIRYLIECLEHCKKGVALTMTTSTSQEYINWLKSLSPQNHWKPNDEQMDALEDAIRYGEEENIGILSLLYNDLKKL